MIHRIDSAFKFPPLTPHPVTGQGKRVDCFALGPLPLRDVLPVIIGLFEDLVDQNV